LKLNVTWGASLTALLGNVFLAAAVTDLAVCALSIANRIKIQVRDEPVFPRDLGLLKEVGSAVGTYQISWPVKQIAVVEDEKMIREELARMLTAGKFVCNF